MSPTAEQLEIQSLARDFAEGELRPHSADWDAAQALGEDVFDSLAELGFLGMTVPEEHGGLGFDTATYLLVLEELARGDASVALSVAIHSGPVTSLLAHHGSEAQKARWLPRLAAGDAVGALALSETDTGGDPSSIDTRARRDEAGQDGGSWILDGEKRWVTGASQAGLVVVFARTDEEDGIGAFLVDTSLDGVTVSGRETTMGFRASETARLRLEDVRVGSDALLGPADHGRTYAHEALDVARVGIAALSVGITRAALEHAIRYATEREQFGRSIARFGAIQGKLADMQQRVSGARALTHRAGEAVQALVNGGGPRTGPDGLTARAAVAKLAASEAASWVADEAVQIFGGYGYMRDYPVEKLLRDAKGTEIFEGTNEVMRRVIARELLRDA